MKAVELRKWKKYFESRESGHSPEAAAKTARIASSTAYRFERGDQSSTGLEAASTLGINRIGGNLVNQPLSTEALKALDDFAFFRMRYFGRKSMPWQERAAYDMLRALETPEREYLIVNCPPGSGKSTLFTHDIPAWLIARDRSIRAFVGSRTERQGRMYAGRIKKTLEREAPLRAGLDAVEDGVQWDAQSTLYDDFGAFKPEGRSELWRAESMVVRQLDGVALDDKEPTVSAWGQESGFLGGRFDFIVWDDLVDGQNTRNAETKEKLQEWWDTEAETRLEPRGVLVVQGQRIAYNDLYRYCLDKKTMDDEPKYRHIIYKAHDTERCQGHDDDSPSNRPPAWPEGCLLDPYRLPFKFLEGIRIDKPRVFDVQYQQNDGDQVGGLVEEQWIKGGTDSNGYPCPGCLDDQRSVNQVPEHFFNQMHWSYVTVDPSPTEYWGVVWWVYDPASGNRYAIDLIRKRMNPEDFLSMDLDTGQFSGLCVDLRATAMLQKVPITHIIVETNAAQKWLLSQPHVQRWMMETGIRFIPHTTTINKRDPKYGFESIGDQFRQGKIRLPWADPHSRGKSQALIKEALQYPESDTDDMLMTTWFSKLAVENHYNPRNRFGYSQPRNPEFAQASRGLVNW